MSTRNFTSEEVENLVWESEVYRDEIDSGRWSMYIQSVVQTEDGRFYRVNWSEGLTEYQDNDYDGGEYPEVFPVQGVSSVDVGTTYVTDTTPYDHKNDADSVRLLGADQTYKDAIEDIDTEDLAKIKETFKKLSVFDTFGDSVKNKNLRIAAEEYLDRMTDAIENFR